MPIDTSLLQSYNSQYQKTFYPKAAVLPEGSRTCELVDVNIREHTVPAQYQKEGGPDKRLKVHFILKPIGGNDDEFFDYSVGLSYARTSKLPTVLSQMDPDGLTKAKNEAYAKDFSNTKIIPHLEALVGRYFKVKSAPSDCGKYNNIQSVFATDAPVNRQTKPTSTVKSGFEAMPDADDDDIPF